MTRVTEITVTIDHQQHVIYVKSGLKTRSALMIIVISVPLPVKLPIKNSPKKISIAPKDATWNFRGSPCEQFLNTMTTREDMDEIVLFGTKVPNNSATVNRVFEQKSHVYVFHKRIFLFYNGVTPVFQKKNSITTYKWLFHVSQYCGWCWAYFEQCTYKNAFLLRIIVL